MKKETKKRLAIAATGVAAAGAVVISLANASGLEAIFEPKSYERFRNQKQAEEYDYVAGDGEDAALADRDKEQGDKAGKDDDQFLQVMDKSMLESEADQTAQGQPNQGSYGIISDDTAGSAELTDGITFADGTGGSTGTGGTVSGIGNGTGQTGTDGNTGTENNGGNAGDNGGTGDNGTGGDNENTGGNGSDTDPVKPDDPTDPDDPISWEDEQLKPMDPVETEYGTLVSLSAEFQIPYYCRNDVFQASDAVVTGTFRDSDGNLVKKVLPYGTGGYSVAISMQYAGDYYAVFSYAGMSARVPYKVLYSSVLVSYQAKYKSESTGEDIYYRSIFPSQALLNLVESQTEKDTLAALGETKTYYPVGGYIDFMDAHRRMIAYLGNASVAQSFYDYNADNTRSVTFLTEGEDGYLKTMLQGFCQYSQNQLLEDTTVIYYPASDWGRIQRAMMNLVDDVPEGYKIRRVTEHEDSWTEYKGDQVLEAYEGTDSTMTIPMGTTKVDLIKDAASVKTLVIPESVREMDLASIAEHLPNLEAFETTGNSRTYQVRDGILYDAAGTTVLAVPAGKKDIVIPAETTALAEGCFQKVKADQITFAGEAVPKVQGETGYTGTIQVSDSVHDTVRRAYEFSFGSYGDGISFVTEAKKTDEYVYRSGGPVLVRHGEETTLAAVPADASGRYTVDDTITKIGTEAFAGSSRLSSVELGSAVTELESGSLILPESVISVRVNQAGVRISPTVFGDPAEGNTVPDLKIYVNDSDYEAYLESWSAALDPVYGIGTAEGLLRSEGMTLYENGVLYEIIEDGDGFRYRLAEVLAKDVKALTVREGTTEIADNAFDHCSSLELLSLPETLSGLPEGALSDCTALETVVSENPDFRAAGISGEVLCTGTEYQSFSMEDGILYGENTDGTWTLLNVRSDYADTLVIREQTVKIHKQALMGCSSLTAINVLEPEALTEIGAEAFSEIQISGTVDFEPFTNLTVIGQGAFKNCKHLTAVKLPSGVDSLPAEIFSGCEALTDVEAASLTEIGDEAFSGCIRITHIGGMASTRSLGKRAFQNCVNIISFELPESLVSMGEGCFENCPELKTIVMNSSLTGISRYCFYGCRALTSVVMSDHQKECLTIIGVQAFGQCSSLADLDLSGTGLARMGERTFEGCQSLATVKLPESLEAVPDYCFEDCLNLSVVRLYGGTKTFLGENVFGTTIPDFLHLCVPAGTEGDWRGEYEALLDGQYGAGSTTEILGAIDDKMEVLQGITYELTDEGRVLVKASTKITGDYTIPVDTIRIEDEAFKDCTGLTSITALRDTTMALGNRCFIGCSGLKKVALECSITDWGDETFMDCKGIETLVLGGIYPVGEEPNVINRIGTRAFKGCTGLTGTSSVGGITFRAITPVWGKECFADCENLYSVAFTDQARASLETMEDSVFENCRSLASFLNTKYTGLKTLGAYVFRNCDSLKQPTVPAGVTSIGEGCFMDCDNLQYVSFYAALEEYPKDCFKNCPKLIRTGGTAAAFNGLKRIGESAYEGCTSLVQSSSWYLGRYANLEEIGDRAFYGCKSLTAVPITNGILQVYLSQSLIKLGNHVFDGCTGIGELYFNGTSAPQFGSMDLTSMTENFRILVSDSQEQDDVVYRSYFEALAEVLGKTDAYEILDSQTDGAKARNPLPEEVIEPAETEPEETGSGETDPAKASETGEAGNGETDPAKASETGETGSGETDPAKASETGETGSGETDPAKASEAGEAESKEETQTGAGAETGTEETGSSAESSAAETGSSAETEAAESGREPNEASE